MIFNQNPTAKLVPAFIFAFIIFHIFINLYTAKFVSPFKLGGDEPEYVEIAHNLLAGKGLALYGKPTAIRPPIYPLFLALNIKIFGDNNMVLGVRVIQSFMNLILLFEIACLSCLFFKNFNIMLLSIAISSLFAPFIFFSNNLLSDQLSCILVLSVFIFGAQIVNSENPKRVYLYSLLIGLAASLALLCRSNTAILILSLIPFFIQLKRKKEMFRSLLITFGIIFIFWGLWIGRNYMVFKEFIPLNTYSGANLWLGNNPDIRGAQGIMLATPPLPEQYKDSEIFRDKYFRALGFEYIKTHPVVFLKRIPVKLKAFFAPLLHIDRTSYMGYYLLGFGGISLILGLFRRKKLPYIILYTLIFWGCSLYVYSARPVEEALVWHKYATFLLMKFCLGLQQIRLFVILGIILLIAKRPLPISRYLPVLIYIALTLLVAVVYVPKMRIRFGLDPFFIILAAYALNWIWTFRRN